MLNLSAFDTNKIKNFISKKSEFEEIICIKGLNVFDRNYDLDLNLINYVTPDINNICVLTLVKQTEHKFNHIDKFDFAYLALNSEGKLLEFNDGFNKLITKFNNNITIDITNAILNNGGKNYTINPNRIKQSYLRLKDKKGTSKTFFIIYHLHKETKFESNNSFRIECLLLESDNINSKEEIDKEKLIAQSWKYFFKDSFYPISLVDMEEKIVKANKSFLKLFSPSIINKKIATIFTEKENKQITKNLKELNSKHSKNNLVTNKNIRIADRIYNIYFEKIKSTYQQFGTLLYLIDVTHQNELEENLSHGQRMQTIGHLVGAVAHDFNNILTAISGFCDILLNRHSIGDPSFSDIMQIKQSSDRATTLIRRLLAFSRKQTLKPLSVNPSELFSDSYPLIQRLIGSQIKFSQKISPDVWKIKVDPVQMQQVILNLVVNAHQAMQNDGILNINVENLILKKISKQLRGYICPLDEEKPKAGEYVAITVEDSGEGINENIIKKIFEPFFTTKGEKIGTGLGLSTVYGIVRQSEGFIFVKSKKGLGTTFLLLFQKSDDSDENFVIKEVTAINSKSTKLNFPPTGKIVLVEDEEAIRVFAKSVLTTKGYEVIEFASAQKALEELPAIINNINLIISDVVMPEMSGPHLISQLKKIKPDIKVIFISGFGEEAFTAEYGKNRDFHFMPKPFSLKQLLEKIRIVLEE